MDNDLISREALKEDLAKEIKTNDMGLWLKILLVIDNAPTVDMSTELSVVYLKGRRQGQSDERPHGEWIDHSDEGYVECPFCGSATTCEDNKDELHYCWSCGAEMQRCGAEMNNEDAIKEIMEIIPVLDNVFVFSAKDKRTALKLAIESLKNERPQGKWIDYDNTFYKCPECGYLLEKCCPQCQNKVILPLGGES